MKKYELTYLLLPETQEPQIQTFIQLISDFINQEGGKSETSLFVEKKRLGYPIKKISEAFVGVLNFHLEAEKLTEHEKKLKTQKEIIRYAIFKKGVPKAIKIRKRIPLKDGTEIGAEKVLAPQTTQELEKKEELARESKTKKVGLKEIEKKLEEILGE